MKVGTFILGFVLVASMVLSGCEGSKSAEPTTPPRPAEETAPETEETIKTMDEYLEDAEREISTENAEEELERLEKEIEEDIGAEE